MRATALKAGGGWAAVLQNGSISVGTKHQTFSVKQILNCFLIATRLEKVLPHIIHPSQSGYIKGRFIGESIRQITDIMEFTKSSKFLVSPYFWTLKKLLILSNGIIFKSAFQASTSVPNNVSGSEYSIKTFLVVC